MLRAALAFFVFGILAFILGANQVAGVSMDIGKMLLGLFLFVAILLFISALFIGRKIKQL